MATLFWVGGTGTWDNATNTHWASVSGGAGGAGIPTAADDVIFDSSSGSGTSTATSGTALCKTLTTSGSMVIGGTPTVSGNVSLAHTGSAITLSLIINATGSINLGGKTLSGITVSASAGTVTAAAAITLNGTFTLTSGTFNTAGFSLNATSFSSSNSNVRTLTLGSSAVTLTGGTPWLATTVTNLTVTANTAVVTMNAASASFIGPKDWNGLSLVFTGTLNAQISGSTGIVLKNLTRTGTSAKTDTLQLFQVTTLTGNLVVNGASADNRLLVTSNNIGTQVGLAVAGTVTGSYVDFQDIAALDGAGSPTTWNLSAMTGGSGDALGNTGITFTSAQTNYWVGSAGSWSDVNKWASTTGGSAASGRMPLPQDTARIDGNSFGSSGVLTIDIPRACAIVDMTGASTSFITSVNSSSKTTFYGSITIIGGPSFTGSGFTLGGRSSHTVNKTSSGASTWSSSITVNAPGGTYTTTVTNGDWWINGTSDFTLTQGTWNSSACSKQVALTFIAGGTATSSLYTPPVVELTSTGTQSVWNVGVGVTTGMSTTTLKVTTTASVATTRTIKSGGYTYGGVDYTVAGTTGPLVLTGGGTFGSIKVSGGTRTLQFTIGTTTTVADWQVFGTAGNLVTVTSTATATPATLAYSGAGVVSSDYLSIKDISATPATLTWYAGNNSTNVSGNTGWIFTSPPLVNGDAAMAALSSLTTTAVDTELSSPALTGVATLGVSAVDTVPSAIPLTAASTLTPLTGVTANAIATLTGAGTLTVGSTLTRLGAATLQAWSFINGQKSLVLRFNSTVGSDFYPRMSSAGMQVTLLDQSAMPTVTEALTAGYRLIIFDSRYVDVPAAQLTRAYDYYQAGINVITAGNDTTFTAGNPIWTSFNDPGASNLLGNTVGALPTHPISQAWTPYNDTDGRRWVVGARATAQVVVKYSNSLLGDTTMAAVIAEQNPNGNGARYVHCEPYGMPAASTAAMVEWVTGGPNAFIGRFAASPLVARSDLLFRSLSAATYYSNPTTLPSVPVTWTGVTSTTIVMELDDQTIPRTRPSVLCYGGTWSTDNNVLIMTDEATAGANISLYTWNSAISGAIQRMFPRPAPGWHKYAFTYDTTNSTTPWKAWVDGVAQTLTTPSGGANPNPTSLNGSGLKYAGYQPAPDPYSGATLMMVPIVYTTALSDTAAQQASIITNTAPVITAVASDTMQAVSSLTTAGTVLPGVPLVAASTLTTGALVTEKATATLTAAATMNASGVLTRLGAATLSAAGVLSVASVVITSGIATMSAAGVITVNATVLPGAALRAVSTLTINALLFTVLPVSTGPAVAALPDPPTAWMSVSSSSTMIVTGTVKVTGSLVGIGSSTMAWTSVLSGALLMTGVSTASAPTPAINTSSALMFSGSSTMVMTASVVQSHSASTGGFSLGGFAALTVDTGPVVIPSPITIRNLLSVTPTMQTPVIVNGQPILPDYVGRSASSMTTAGTYSVAAAPSPSSSMNVMPIAPTWRWLASDIPGQENEMVLTWPEHTGTGPTFRSNTSFAPTIGDLVHYDTSSRTDIDMGRVLTFYWRYAQHMGLVMDAPHRMSTPQPFTLQFVLMAHTMTSNQFQHIWDSGTLVTDGFYTDPTSGIAELISDAVYQNKVVPIADDTSGRAYFGLRPNAVETLYNNTPHVAQITPTTIVDSRPLVYTCIFNAGSLSRVRIRGYGVNETLAADQKTSVVNDFVLGRAQQRIGSTAAAHMNVWEVLFYNRALTEDELGQNSHWLGGIYKFSSFH